MKNILTILPTLFVLATREALKAQPLTNYSYLSASTGFLVAARQLCQPTVNNAIPNASKPANAKIHQLKVVL